jgi:hypothetical protein
MLEKLRVQSYCEYNYSWDILICPRVQQSCFRLCSRTAGGRTANRLPNSAVRQAVIYQLSARQTSAHRQEHPACSARKCGANSMLLLWTGDDECGMYEAKMMMVFTHHRLSCFGADKPSGASSSQLDSSQRTWLVPCSATMIQHLSTADEPPKSFLGLELLQVKSKYS